MEPLPISTLETMSGILDSPEIEYTLNDLEDNKDVLSETELATRHFEKTGDQFCEYYRQVLRRVIEGNENLLIFHAKDDQTPTGRFTTR